MKLHRSQLKEPFTRMRFFEEAPKAEPNTKLLGLQRLSETINLI